MTAVLIPKADLPHLTERDLNKALRAYYGVTYGNGRRYVAASQVRSHAGFDARRTADFIAMDLWPSKGLLLHGHEIKVSRSDWLAELKHPEKAAEFIPYMNCWWLVVSDRSIIHDGELPSGWGLMAMSGACLRVFKKAKRHDAKPLPPARLAAFLRAVADSARVTGRD
jgi:hypothetical protein